MLSGTLRVEYFNDQDGVRTGVKQTLWEITPTLSFQPAWLFPGVTVRIEYRHDESNHKFFQGPGIPTGTRLFQGQDVFAWQFVYAF
jgi:hypothetical protein